MGFEGWSIAHGQHRASISAVARVCRPDPKTVRQPSILARIALRRTERCTEGQSILLVPWKNESGAGAPSPSLPHRPVAAGPERPAREPGLPGHGHGAGGDLGQPDGRIPGEAARRISPPSSTVIKSSAWSRRSKTRPTLSGSGVANNLSDRMRSGGRILGQSQTGRRSLQPRVFTLSAKEHARSSTGSTPNSSPPSGRRPIG